MCLATNRSKPTRVCTLGDLQPGTEFHDPNGERWMVLRPLPPTAVAAFDDSVLVVNLGNGLGNHYGNALRNDEFKGKVTPMYGATVMAYDARGRFYASTALNDWYLPADFAPAADLPLTQPVDDLPTTPDGSVDVDALRAEPNPADDATLPGGNS